MSCCNRSKANKTIRAQKITKSKVEKQRIIRQSRKIEASKATQAIYKLDEFANNIEKERQKITILSRCPKCDNIVSKVNIAGRERLQCTNANCRKIIR